MKILLKFLALDNFSMYDSDNYSMYNSNNYSMCNYFEMEYDNIIYNNPISFESDFNIIQNNTTININFTQKKSQNPQKTDNRPYPKWNDMKCDTYNIWHYFLRSNDMLNFLIRKINKSNKYSHYIHVTIMDENGIYDRSYFLLKSGGLIKYNMRISKIYLNRHKYWTGIRNAVKVRNQQRGMVGLNGL